MPFAKSKKQSRWFKVVGFLGGGRWVDCTFCTSRKRLKSAIDRRTGAFVVFYRGLQSRGQGFGFLIAANPL